MKSALPQDVNNNNNNFSILGYLANLDKTTPEQQDELQTWFYLQDETGSGTDNHLETIHDTIYEQNISIPARELLQQKPITKLIAQADYIIELGPEPQSVIKKQIKKDQKYIAVDISSRLIDKTQQQGGNHESILANRYTADLPFIIPRNKKVVFVIDKNVGNMSEQARKKLFQKMNSYNTIGIICTYFPPRKNLDTTEQQKLEAIYGAHNKYSNSKTEQASADRILKKLYSLGFPKEKIQYHIQVNQKKGHIEEGIRLVNDVTIGGTTRKANTTLLPCISKGFSEKEVNQRAKEINAQRYYPGKLQKEYIKIAILKPQKRVEVAHNIITLLFSILLIGTLSYQKLSTERTQKIQTALEQIITENIGQKELTFTQHTDGFTLGGDPPKDLTTLKNIVEEITSTIQSLTNCDENTYLNLQKMVSDLISGNQQTLSQLGDLTNRSICINHIINQLIHENPLLVNHIQPCRNKHKIEIINTITSNKVRKDIKTPSKTGKLKTLQGYLIDELTRGIYEGNIYTKTYYRDDYGAKEGLDLALDLLIKNDYQFYQLTQMWRQNTSMNWRENIPQGILQALAKKYLGQQGGGKRDNTIAIKMITSLFEENQQYLIQNNMIPFQRAKYRFENISLSYSQHQISEKDANYTIIYGDITSYFIYTQKGERYVALFKCPDGKERFFFNANQYHRYRNAPSENEKPIMGTLQMTIEKKGSINPKHIF